MKYFYWQRNCSWTENSTAAYFCRNSRFGTCIFAFDEIPHQTNNKCIEWSLLAFWCYVSRLSAMCTGIKFCTAHQLQHKDTQRDKIVSCYVVIYTVISTTAYLSFHHWKHRGLCLEFLCQLLYSCCDTSFVIISTNAFCLSWSLVGSCVRNAKQTA